MKKKEFILIFSLKITMKVRKKCDRICFFFPNFSHLYIIYFFLYLFFYPVCLAGWWGSTGAVPAHLPGGRGPRARLCRHQVSRFYRCRMRIYMYVYVVWLVIRAGLCNLTLLALRVNIWSIYSWPRRATHARRADYPHTKIKVSPLTSLQKEKKICFS